MMIILGEIVDTMRVWEGLCRGDDLFMVAFLSMYVDVDHDHTK